MIYDFEWDPDKARVNRRKHGVAFEHAAMVFRDPRALSVFDEKHSRTEERWITIGISPGGGLLVVHHTFRQVDEKTMRIRIFSSRKATRKEIAQYGE